MKTYYSLVFEEKTKRYSAITLNSIGDIEKFVMLYGLDRQSKLTVKKIWQIRNRKDDPKGYQDDFDFLDNYCKALAEGRIKIEDLPIRIVPGISSNSLNKYLI